MAYYKRESLFDKFFNHRDALIIQYINGDITKREFLKLNFEYIQKMNVKPFSRIDSFEKGMYNYQYYNMLAKYYYMTAMDIKKKNKHFDYYRACIDEANYYYNLKDRATLKLLRFLKFKNVEAYFIKVQSRFLKDKLYEIDLKDYENAILHSKSPWLLKILKDEGVFFEGVRKSLIDSYINEKY
ncbi:hypothetical protein SAMN02745135_01561 [Caloranaerobacter azorensis DSM 13643]|uniref:Uncharacterized protein n=1 Tax=Caloranaerobacter azorensis DSM 13643 TaxID=1121264 RepID=A0A1M5USC0_9FIRM|nr:DUF6648 family protein [Caloranaerobacter azorensis]SHH65845.1 hypothetical protein SAMN02745135_01561 [Caloranaerobacter azorensis DSM 13643]